VAALAVSAVVLLAFVRFPVPTLGVLVAVWLVGYILYLSRKRRTDLEDQLRRLDLERRDGERQRDRR
jgi:Na+/melibiose symporter-like transporter